MKRQRHSLNVVGDFFVENDCCLNCGVPQHHAPELFGTGPESCFVSKQPASDTELEQMLSVMQIQEVNCVRYAGQDAAIVQRIIEQGDGALIVADGLEHAADEPPAHSFLVKAIRRLLRW